MNLWAGFENASADNAQQIIQQVKCKCKIFFLFLFYYMSGKISLKYIYILKI